MNAIVCFNSNKGIGYGGKIPWKSTIDLKYFKEKTIGKGNNAIIMGYKTFASIGYKPLPDRRNYVLTRNPEFSSLHNGSDVIFESSVENLIMLPSIFDEVYVVGGNETYSSFEPYYKKIFVTVIENKSKCDTYFTLDLSKYQKSIIYQTYDNKQKLTFCEYNRTL